MPWQLTLTTPVAPLFFQSVIVFLERWMKEYKILFWYQSIDFINTYCTKFVSSTHIKLWFTFFSLFFFFGQVFVRMGLTCGNHIEYAYYSAGIGRPDLCCYCGEEGAQRSVALVQKYKTVLPMCQTCMSNGKEQIYKRPRPGTQTWTENSLSDDVGLFELLILTACVIESDVSF